MEERTIESQSPRLSDLTELQVIERYEPGCSAHAPGDAAARVLDHGRRGPKFGEPVKVEEIERTEEVRLGLLRHRFPMPIDRSLRVLDVVDIVGCCFSLLEIDVRFVSFGVIASRHGMLLFRVGVGDDRRRMKGCVSRTENKRIIG